MINTCSRESNKQTKIVIVKHKQNRTIPEGMEGLVVGLGLDFELEVEGRVEGEVGLVVGATVISVLLIYSKN